MKLYTAQNLLIFMSDIEITTGPKPKAKFDLDPIEWLIISVTVIISIFIVNVL